jgi:hypothetical protein
MTVAVCDLCNEDVTDFKRYSASQMQAAAQAGLRPRGAAANIGAALGVPDEGWLQMVMSDPTDWGVCSTCAEEVNKFL